MISDAERRFASQFNDGKDMPIQVRAADSGKQTIGGYAAKFDRRSQNLGGFRERIAPGFFNYSRSQGWPGVLARYNHDDNMLLGTTGAQTLRLDVDNVGLLYDVDTPKSRADVYELTERGDVRQSSFAFVADEDEWTTDDAGFPLRTLVSGRLFDVAPVNTPAYLDTSVGLRGATEARSLGGAQLGPDIAFRSLAKQFEAEIDEVRKMAAANDLMKFFKRSDGGTAPDPKAAEAALSPQAALMRAKNAPGLNLPK